MLVASFPLRVTGPARPATAPGWHTTRLSAPGSSTGTEPAFSTRGARHGSGGPLAGAVVAGRLAASELDAGSLAGAETATALAAGEPSGLAEVVDGALLSGDGGQPEATNSRPSRWFD